MKVKIKSFAIKENDIFNIPIVVQSDDYIHLPLEYEDSLEAIIKNSPVLGNRILLALKEVIEAIDFKKEKGKSVMFKIETANGICDCWTDLIDEYKEEKTTEKKVKKKKFTTIRIKIKIKFR